MMRQYIPLEKPFLRFGVDELGKLRNGPHGTIVMPEGMQTLGQMRDARLSNVCERHNA